MKLILAALMAVWLCAPARAGVVSAESVYADIARQVAGPAVEVSAILENPAGDPHQFEPNPSVARRVAGATIVIENGIGYDGWMDRLLAVGTKPGRVRIVVADLLHRRAGDNPHLWYDPAAMPALTRKLAEALVVANPADRAGILVRRDATLARLAAVQALVDTLRQRMQGVAVAATEPVFGPMLDALGLVDQHGRFEVAVMNGSEPRAGDVAAIEDDLKAHRIRVLITNAQATDTEAARLAGVARAEHVPLMAVTETLPPGMSYEAWISGELAALEQAVFAETAAR